MKKRIEYDFTAQLVTNCVIAFGLGEHPYLCSDEKPISNWIVTKDAVNGMSWLEATPEQIDIMIRKLPLAFTDSIERKARLVHCSCTKEGRDVAANRLCLLENKLNNEDTTEIRHEIYMLQNFVWSWDQAQIYSARFCQIL